MTNNDTKPQTTTSQILRSRLEQVRARYDTGAIPQALFEAVKAMEVEIGWTEMRAAERKGGQS